MIKFSHILPQEKLGIFWAGTQNEWVSEPSELSEPRTPCLSLPCMFWIILSKFCFCYICQCTFIVCIFFCCTACVGCPCPAIQSGFPTITPSCGPSRNYLSINTPIKIPSHRVEPGTTDEDAQGCNISRSNRELREKQIKHLELSTFGFYSTIWVITEVKCWI